MLLAWIIASAASASELSSVRVAVRATDGMTEVLSQLDAEESPLVGFRGCANEALECDASLRLNAARREAVQGDVMTIFVNGSGTAESIRVTRGKSVIRDIHAAELPAVVEVGALEEGERVEVQVQMGTETVESSAGAATLRLAAASISGVTIRNYVWATPPGKPAGYYQVIEGSGTGGGFVRSAACHTYVCIEGYTDRVSRGEYAFSSFQGSGYANRVGWKYDGSGRTYATAANLDYVMPTDRMVSTNPSDDNLYAFAETPLVRKRIPIGTR
jgi:hypothetical protein